MQTMTELALERAQCGVFTRPELMSWIGDRSARLDGLLKRAIAAGEIIPLRRGLYCLAVKYLRAPLDPLALAQFVHGPSYVSCESALSFHGWIPEAVHAVTSVTGQRSRQFETPLGLFVFTRVPQAALYLGVEQVRTGQGGSLLVASPLKAVADYVHVHGCDWTSRGPLLVSLRIDEDALGQLRPRHFAGLAANYRSARVRRFLDHLRRDIGR